MIFFYLLERLLSIAYHQKYSLSAVEHEISYSPYFQKIEKDHDGYSPIIDETSLIKEIFKDDNIKSMDIPSYNQCMWAAEAYLRIQGETRLTFEAIFLYMPIADIYNYFPLFHEMDFSHIINEFKRLYSERSILDLLLDKYHYSVKEISERINVPYETLYSYKQRRRDIRKINADVAYVLSSVLKVRIETLLELSI